jgi:two-component sensor histidine kinase
MVDSEESRHSVERPIPSPLAMAFHELATNAAKYGALSVSAGRIEIYWQPVRVADHKRSVLRIDWLEKGGPPVTYPRQRSFGSKIEGSIAAELGGTARLTFAPEGLHCEIAPLEKPAQIFGRASRIEGGVWHGAPGSRWPSDVHGIRICPWRCRWWLPT